MLAEKLLGFDVAGAGGPARADGDELARVFVGVGAVEVLLGGCGERSERSAKEED